MLTYFLNYLTSGVLTKKKKNLSLVLVLFRNFILHFRKIGHGCGLHVGTSVPRPLSLPGFRSAGVLAEGNNITNTVQYQK